MGRVGCSTTRGLWLVTCMQLALAGGTPAELFLLEGWGKSAFVSLFSSLLNSVTDIKQSIHLSGYTYSWG
mgnify:CR=1 FL=1